MICLIISSASAQSVSEKRSFMKSVKINKDARLEVINKYGDIKITSWNKDSVSVMAEIEAFAPNQTKLRKMFDGLNIDITQTDYLIRAKTEFDQNLSVMLESFKGLTEKIINYDSRVQINYFINIPEYVDVSIENQFGDITMENNKGDISISLSNGDFKANSLNRISEFTLNFGEAEIGSLVSGKINTTFSELVITQCGDLSINSTSSRFDVKKAEKLHLESRRDKFFGGSISELGGTSYFTDFKIESILKNIDLTLKYGSLDVERTENRFEKINLISAYSDITFGFDPSASYEFEIRHTNAFVVIPDKNTRSKKEALNDNKKEYFTSGTFGNNPGSRRVIIEATRGNIYLR